MESILWTAKFVMFFIMEAFVIGVVATVLIAGVYQIVRDRARREIEIPMGRSHLPTRAE